MPPSINQNPEQRARDKIDLQLEQLNILLEYYLKGKGEPVRRK